MKGSNREQRRLNAAEEVCRATRKALTYAGTKYHYLSIALDWLLVWLENAPKKVWQADPAPPKIRKRK